MYAGIGAIELMPVRTFFSDALDMIYEVSVIVALHICRLLIAHTMIILTLVLYRLGIT